jgi:protein phosphatase 1 regulatory subunit 7
MTNFLKRQIRINDPIEINEEIIENDLKSGNHVIVQFSNREYYNDQILKKINQLCIRNDDSFGVRFFGHHSSIFDCNVLSNIPNVKALYLDCLQAIHNLNTITKLDHLEMLNLDVYNLEDSDILRANNLRNLKTLIISSGKRTINLEYIKDNKQLKALIVSGKIKNIDAIGDVAELEFLSLNSVSKSSIAFINKLKRLRTLKFILGGRDNINEIEENHIETLEIIRVRGFNDFKNISKFRELRNLLIEDQPQLLKIDFQDKLNKLENLNVLNCKNLTDISNLDNLISLKKLRIYKTNIDFDSFINQIKDVSLNEVGFYTGKTKVDKEIEKSLLNLGYIVS